ncbi:hypothetical protein GEO20_08780 [Rhodococcus erythropolis]|uniref:hypothetical protein n=1 Tax=Rhodococcus erythropolis TaxID=1833 RepID=UPI001291207D|nr:hypothetical protein [Rhodococcus erythropolis]MQP32059.1 hypothetical protein [Rhodococcus erythropolis]
MNASLPDADLRSNEFTLAWQSLDSAHQLRRDIAANWNALNQEEMFDCWIEADETGAGSIGVTIDWPPRANALQQVGRNFVKSIKSSLDEAIRVTEQLTSGALVTPDHSVGFPLCRNAHEFVAHYRSGALAGLRPDHLQLIEVFQPYAVDADTPDRIAMVRSTMNLLKSLIELPEDTNMIGVWAHSADPTIIVDSPHRVADMTIEPPSLIEHSSVIAQFRVEPPNGARGLLGRPGIAFDVALAIPPWPHDPDVDTLDRRCTAILAVAEEIVRGFERSVGVRNDRPATVHPNPPDDYHDQNDGRWAPIDSSAIPNLEDQLAQSDLGLAVYRDNEQHMVMLVHTEDGVFGRSIPQARVLEPTVRRGTAAENAALGAAARWGLADFVLVPKKINKGTASRELGDGTVIFGDRALAIQVKSRDASSDATPDREQRWIAKNGAKGARQAAGTIRTLTATPTTIDNARGRPLHIDGAAYTWVGVVIIDHDDPPENIAPIGSTPTVSVVALLRREWEFLFDQLRSITAVGAYLHRIEADSVAPGEHVQHYYELSDADHRSTNVQDPSNMHTDPTGQRFSYPSLPREPASSIDEDGAAMFRQILEDLATSPWDRPEMDRLSVLHLLDQHPVMERAQIGRRLLDKLKTATTLLGGETRFEHRRYILGDNDLHLAFSVCNHLSSHHREAFKRWTMLRHYDWSNRLGANARQDCKTVSVLLTPRHDGLRPWDTTMYAIHGDLEIEDDELTAFRELFGSTP